MKNNTTFFIFVPFAAILVQTTTWNDLLCSWVGNVSGCPQIVFFFFQSPNGFQQLNFRLDSTHFASQMTSRNDCRHRKVASRNVKKFAAVLVLFTKWNGQWALIEDKDSLFKFVSPNRSYQLNSRIDGDIRLWIMAHWLHKSKVCSRSHRRSPRLSFLSFVRGK